MPGRVHILVRVSLLTAFSLLLFCCNSREGEVKRGVKFAKRRIEEVERNPMARVALASALETGGSFSTYLAASLPPDSDLPPFYDKIPQRSWCVVFKETSGDHVVIEGYGEDLSRPIITENARITALSFD